jgi:hypothetical protein
MGVNVSSAINPPGGSCFHTRCPGRRHILPHSGRVCKTVVPLWRGAKRHRIVCHIALEEPSWLSSTVYITKVHNSWLGVYKPWTGTEAAIIFPTCNVLGGVREVPERVYQCVWVPIRCPVTSRVSVTTVNASRSMSLIICLSRDSSRNVITVYKICSSLPLYPP